VEGTLLQKYLPDVYFALISRTEHVLGDILITTNMDIFGKCANGALMEIGTVLLGDCD
jgi:hypothetical protein